MFAEAQGFLRTTMGARVELSRLCLAATPSSQPEQLPFSLFSMELRFYCMESLKVTAVRLADQYTQEMVVF